MSTQNQQKQPPKGLKKPEVVPFRALFRFATRKQHFLMIIGSIASFANGVATPFLSLLIGDVADGFGPNHTGDEIVDNGITIAWKFAILGFVAFIASYIGYTSWVIVGEQQSIEIRRRYFKSLLSQEIAFYDSINPNEISSKIADECLNIQQGIGEKVPMFLDCMGVLISGFVIGLIRGWQLALVMTASIPFIAISGAIFFVAIFKLGRVNFETGAKAGAISEEVLNAIRTVVSLGGEEKESKRYHTALNSNNKLIMKSAILSGVCMGLLFFVLFGVYALSFYIGSIFIENGVETSSGTPYTAGSVLSVFYAIIMVGTVPVRIVPSVRAFANAKAAAAKAFKIIDRKSQISMEDPTGLKPKNVEGNISFKDVTFSYPSKEDRVVLNGISFDIKTNEKTALVGESGCGKTTCLQLIERFYDIGNKNGSITLDGNELKDLNLKWMRENIGYVGQEPVLFGTSIKENLLMAKVNATEEEIWDALKKANAADFVRSLPETIHTFVGANGTQLSGGQKQRLAIARAILKNPRILLLDEATSALDRKNEMEIQKTLDEISEGRTTIVIAHRLTTIQNADHIIVFDQGKVVEEGQHDALIANKGKYYTLQHLQLQAKDEKEKDSDEEKYSDEEVKAKTETDASPLEIQKKKPSSLKKESLSRKAEVKVIDDNSANTKTINKAKGNLLLRLLRYNKEDYHLLFLGVLGALAQGVVFPVQSIIMSNMVEVFAMPGASNYRSRSNLLALLFLILGIVALVANTLQMSCLTLVAERLSRRIKYDVFRKFMKMHIGWFDQPENSAGALSSKLATDATRLNSLTSSIFGSIAQGLSAFISGIVIAMLGSWQLTLAGLALTPIKIIVGKLRVRFGQNFVLGNGAAYQQSVVFVSEAVNNMRTVASFGNEDKLMENYSEKLNGPFKTAVRNGHCLGAAYGASMFIDSLINGIVYILGAVFIRDIGLNFQSMFQSTMGISMTAQGTGNAIQFAPDIGAAKAAAMNVFGILDAETKIDIDSPNQTVKNRIKGDVEFKNVWFKYPSREKQIFKGLNLKISASNKVALVGPSGCGKSTILALLQRFYDPDQGEILIDGVSIKNYDLRHLRESFGVVSQEPVLFNGTIEYNIKYSKEVAADDEMREAALKANALGFIEKNDFGMNDDAANEKYGTGFQRKVGPKGSQLSGGQKQRIAIARAIIRNPSFLILDEATSALDAENEKLVQESLDKIMEGKTSLIVAHRISTIKDADEIVVFNEGEIIERGDYKKLTELQGIFYKLERGLNLGV